MNVGEFNDLFSDAMTDPVSLEKLYLYFCPKIVLHITVKFNADNARDIAQDFFSRLIEGEFKNVGYIKSPISWIFRCCDNMAINYFKKEAKYLDFQDIDIQIDDLQLKSETRETLERIFRYLSIGGRKLLYLYSFEGYSLKEISNLMGMTYGSVKQKHHRIIKKLKKFKDIDNF